MALCVFKHESPYIFIKPWSGPSSVFVGGKGGSYHFKHDLKFMMVRMKDLITSVRTLAAEMTEPSFTSGGQSGVR